MNYTIYLSERDPLLYLGMIDKLSHINMMRPTANPIIVSNKMVSTRVLLTYLTCRTQLGNARVRGLTVTQHGRILAFDGIAFRESQHYRYYPNFVSHR